MIHQDSVSAITALSSDEVELVSGGDGTAGKVAVVIAIAEEGYEFAKGFVAGFEARSK